MKTIKSRFMRCITCIALALSMLFPMSMPASAAGVEVWGDNTTTTGPWENIRVTDTNWTPVKTMGRNGTLIIDNFVGRCNSDYCTCSDQEPTNYSQLNVHIKIVNYDTGEVLADDWFREHYVFSYELKTKRPVLQGERIRVFFDVCSLNNPPGPARKAHIQFRYRFT